MMLSIAPRAGFYHMEGLAVMDRRYQDCVTLTPYPIEISPES